MGGEVGLSEHRQSQCTENGEGEVGEHAEVYVREVREDEEAGCWGALCCLPHRLSAGFYAFL